MVREEFKEDGGAVENFVNTSAGMFQEASEILARVL
jgi:hypothetical protein